MTTIVTGAGGMIGEAVMRALRADSREGRRLDRSESGRSWRLGDLVDSSLLEGASSLIHLAWDLDPANAATCVAGSLLLFDQCRGAGIDRIIFVSSQSAGASRPTRYGAAKREVEAALEGHVGALSVRPGLVWSDPPRGAFRRLLEPRLFGWTMTVATPAVLHPVHVDDLAAILVKASASRIPTGVLEAGAMQPLSAQSVAEIAVGPGIRFGFLAQRWAPSRPSSHSLGPVGGSSPIALAASGLSSRWATRRWRCSASHVELSRVLNTSMDSDVIVIGSGPAGVSAAYELLASGRRVTMLEAGADPYATGDTRPDRVVASKSVSSRNTSPKLRTPTASRMLSDYHAAYAVQTDGFELMGTLAVGGLSNVWGAGVAEWTDEFDGWPADARSARDWYPRIAERMGVSGPAEDALTPHIAPTISTQAPVRASAPASALLRSPVADKAADFLLGGVRQAVITSDRDGRQACDLTGQCMTGCPRDAIYSSRFDVRGLLAEPSFSIRPSTTVTAIGQQGDRPYADVVSAGGAPERLSCQRLFVAAGAPASTAFASQIKPTQGRHISIQSTPVIAFAIAPYRGFPHAHSGGYAQAQGAHLSWPRVPPMSSDESLFGYFFNAGSVPVSELFDRLPSVVASLGSPLLRRVWARLVLVTAFMPGRFTDNEISFEPAGPGSPPAIRVCGRLKPELPKAMPAVREFYRRRFARLGWLMVPGSFQQAPVGSDVHYGASMPMTSDPETDGSPLATDTLGRLMPAHHIHFVDGAVLPTLPGKPHTFTVMANAARIAHAVSRLD